MRILEHNRKSVNGYFTMLTKKGEDDFSNENYQFQ